MMKRMTNKYKSSSPTTDPTHNTNTIPSLYKPSHIIQAIQAEEHRAKYPNSFVAFLSFLPFRVLPVCTNSKVQSKRVTKRHKKQTSFRYNNYDRE